MRLPRQPIPGAPITADFGRALVGYVRSNTLRPAPGTRLSTTAGGTCVSVPRAKHPRPPAFSGTAFVSGVRYDGLNSVPTKPWVVVTKTGNPLCRQDAGPPPNPFPENEEWYRKAHTYGDIHVTGW